MNVADSDTIARYFIDANYIPTETLEDADVIVVNTCTVRQHAEDRALSFIGRLKKLKIKNRNLKIIVSGCVASRLGDSLKKRFSFIDEIIPADQVENFSQIIAKVTSGFTDISTCHRLNLSSTHKFIPISRGCSNYCSYCIVPYVRGEERHRPVEEILKQAKEVVKNGTKEITLIGQNVNSYRWQEVDFADLLDIVSKIDGVEKIKFLTNHPKDMSDKIIQTVALNNKIEKFFHLPVQSGSDRILKLMNRSYTKKHYIELVNKIRNFIPEATITTDIIVGFPTESEDDFQETLSLIKEVRFNSLFAFKYSPREMTSAFKLKDDVSLEVKEKRLSAVLQLQKALQKKHKL